MSMFTNAAGHAKGLEFMHKELMFVGQNSMNKGMLGLGGAYGAASGVSSAVGGSLLGAAYGGISDSTTWSEGAGYGAAWGAGLGLVSGAALGAKRAWDIKPTANRYTRAVLENNMMEEAIPINSYKADLGLSAFDDIVLNGRMNDHRERKWSTNNSKLWKDYTEIG